MDDQLKQITERKTSPEDSSLILALAMLELSRKLREQDDTLKTLGDHLNSLQDQIRYLPLIIKLGIGMVTLILTAVGMAIMGWFLKG